MLTPVLPGLELSVGHILALLLAGVLKSKEHSLLECRFRDDLAKRFVLDLHVHVADGGDPSDESLSLATEGPAPHDGHHKVLLSVAMLAEISPSAEEIAELELCLTSRHSI